MILAYIIVLGQIFPADSIGFESVLSASSAESAIQIVFESPDTLGFLRCRLVPELDRGRAEPVGVLENRDRNGIDLIGTIIIMSILRVPIPYEIDQSKVRESN